MDYEGLREELTAFYSKEEAAQAQTHALRFPADPGNGALGKGWAAADFDDSGWEGMGLPGVWASQGLRFSGVLWFRKAVELPADWAGKELVLAIGAVDKTDITYFNGERVGATGEGFDQSVWNVPRSYAVPGRLVKPGRNVVAVRAYSFAYDGGLRGPADTMFLALADRRLPLAGGWKYAVEHHLGQGGMPGHPFWDMMDAYDAAHPGLSAVQLKAAQYEIFAETCRPVVFKNSPFFSELDGGDWNPNFFAGAWLLHRRNGHLFRDVNPEEWDQYMAANRHGIHLTLGYPDAYFHYCFPYSNVLEKGLGQICREAEAELANCATPDESEFVAAAIRGLRAVKKIAGKFADAAAAALPGTADPTQRRFLGMIAKTAREIPWRKPETFYEGLSAVWFLQRLCGVFDGLDSGGAGLARLDLMLGGLYQRDLEAGRVTPDEARDLLCRVMLYPNCMYDSRQSVGTNWNRQELGQVLILGGCDKDGQEVCNDLTFMALRAHRELDLIYPKIHCRITRNTRRDFLDAVNAEFLRGRNVICFLNDEGLIPAQVKAGKSLEDARGYVMGGCWEVIVEGREHSAGANCYFNLARIMDMSVHEHLDVEAATGYVCERIDGATDFADVYRIVMGNVIRTLRRMCTLIGKNGSVWPQVSPAPFFSACLSDCLKNHQDHTAGGGRYNPHGVPLTNFAILVDSLLAVRKLCFETKRHTLAELLTAVRADWEGHAALRAEALNSPHFGDNTPASNALARQILDEIYANTRNLKNERGGPFQLGFYSYRDIIDWAKVTAATPDGRRAGDFLAQGLTPSRLHANLELTSVINSAAALDLTQCPANSLLTVTLPISGVSAQLLAQIERAYAASGVGMLQLNCVDKATLLDAREHPERHQDLVVRLYGYSARFVSLTPEMQEEFVSRTVYGGLNGGGA